jgi:hypothetical protein
MEHETMSTESFCAVLDGIVDWFDQPYTVHVVRHAERGELLPGDDGKHTPLTKSGELQAFAFGKQIPQGRTLTLSHTGLVRTEATARSICAGYQSAGGNVRDPWPIRSRFGGYVRSQEVYRLATQSGFLDSWMKGEVDSSLIDPAPLACRKLISMLFDPENWRAVEAGSLYIHVGHDWDIYVLQFVVLGLLPDSNPAEFLGGISLLRKGNTLSGLRCGYASDIPWNWDEHKDIRGESCPV